MGLDIIVITNGPGELSTWVAPVVRQLRTFVPTANVTVALVPCPYASGNEQEIAGQIPGVSQILSPKETVRYLLTGYLTPGKLIGQTGLVLYLGGDQFFAVLMGWRTSFPSLAYTEKYAHWPRWITRYLLTDQQTYAEHRVRGIDPGKLACVGNLMVDAVQPSLPAIEVRKRLSLSLSAPVIALLPGSKPFKVNYVTPLLLKAADLIAKQNPSAQIVLMQSPYTPLSQLAEAVKNDTYRNATNGAKANLVMSNSGSCFVTEAGTVIDIIPPYWQYNAFSVADLAITVPGTNTAELAILGIPMVVCLPLHKPEVIPLDGLAGRIGDLPFIGKYIKRSIINFMAKRIKLTALPNQKAGAMLVPELIGLISAEQIAEQTTALLSNAYQRRMLSIQLRQVMGATGAAMRVADWCRKTLIAQYPYLESELPKVEIAGQVDREFRSQD